MWDDLDEVRGRRGKSKAEGEQGGINPPYYTERHTARVYILHEISETTEEGILVAWKTAEDDDEG